MKVLKIVYLMILILPFSIAESQLIPRLNTFNALNIQKINPAFSGFDSTVNLSLGTAYQYYSMFNFDFYDMKFGKYEYNPNTPEIHYEIGTRKELNMHDAGISIPVKTKTKMRFGVGINSNADFIDRWVNAYALSIGMAMHYPLAKGNLSFGVEIKSFQFTTPKTLVFDKLDAIKTLKLNENFLNAGLGMAFTDKTGNFRLGVSLMNLKKMDVGVTSFNNNVMYGLYNYSNKSLFINASYQHLISRKVILENSIVMNVFDMDYDLDKYVIQSVCRISKFGIGAHVFLNFPRTRYSSMALGPILDFDSGIVKFRYAYGFTPTRLLSVSAGFHELGVQYKVN